jgi:oligopeptidase A
VVEQRLRRARLAGVGLEGEAAARFAEIVQELSRLSSDFSNNVLDATKAYSLVITDPADVQGWPESLRQQAAASYASQAGAEPDAEQGPWRIGLEATSCVPFLQHCRNRRLREELYRAYITRASSGQFDNSALLERILTLRAEKAALLGFENYAELSLESKAAASVASVRAMHAELSAAARAKAEQDFADLESLAAERGQLEPLAHWDVAFWAERLREERYSFTDEEIRPYFPLERVLNGLFELSERLFGVTIVPADGAAPLWNPAVRYYRVMEQGRDLASFYLDPYVRPHEKRGGAWMDECLSRRRIAGELRLPVVHLVLNSTPPVAGKPSLMSFQEVETLFHEFGHGLQTMLTEIDVADVAGINGVEWDAVEVASQFMENFCYDEPTLKALSGHYETGEPLPDELFAKILAARNYRAASQMMRQVLFGELDLELHSNYAPGGSLTALDVQRELSARYSQLEPLDEDRFLCTFSHIFAGGYAAGYYGYKFAEVLSADVFAAFEEAGPEHYAEVGRRYRASFLALGGSRHPLEVFELFRGRAPETSHLLRANGLI